MQSLSRSKGDFSHEKRYFALYFFFLSTLLLKR